MSDEDDISDMAMTIMGSVAYGGRLPLHISDRQLSRLSEYECLVIDKAVRKAGLQLRRDESEHEFIIEETS